MTAVEWETSDCPACGSREHVVDHVDRLQDPAVAIVACKQCQLRFQNPRPTQGTIGTFYPLDYECYEGLESREVPRKAGLESSILKEKYSHPARGGRPTRKSLADRLRENIAFRRRCTRAEWIEFRGRGRLLDVGCGAGGFLSRMKYRGWEVEGLDITPEVCRRVSERIRVPVHVGTLPDVHLPSGSFDVVTFWQVLEHVPNPVDVLTEARRLLSPGGSIVVTVPNYASTSRKWFPETWIGLDLPRHLIHFTPATLQSTMAAAGLRIVRTQTMAMDGWVRASATRREFAVKRPWVSRLMNWKPLVTAYGRITERFESADNLLVEAVPSHVAASRMAA